MSRKLPSKGVGLRSNWLYSDGQLLTAETTPPDRFATILELGSSAITVALDEMYEQTMQRNPGAEVHYPWLQAIRLCAAGGEPQILTPLGLEPPYTQVSHTLHETMESIVPTLRPYWQVAKAQNFRVRVNSHMQGWDTVHDGTWLQVRPPGRG